MKELVIATAFALIASSPTRGMADDSLRATIQSREDAWSAAFNAGNKDALGAFYEEGAELIPPGSPPVHGRSARASVFSAVGPSCTANPLGSRRGDLH